MSILRKATVTQNVVADPNNSSTGNLYSGATGNTYTGTSTSTLGIAGIQVSLKTDQNCHVYVDQSPDNSNWDITDEYDYFASVGNFGITTQAINSYYRVRVQNLGTAATNYLRLQSALCPIVEAVPRSLDDGGNLRVAIKSTEDAYGWECENTPMGDMRTVTPSRIVGAQFDGSTIDSNFWIGSTSGSTSIAQSNAQVTLTSGTGTGTASLYTTRRARYVSANAMRYRSVIQISASEANNKRRWGVGYGATMPTITDGAWFQLDGSTFSVECMKGGTSTLSITSGNFNGTLGGTYTPGTGAQTYEVYWTNSKVYFSVGGEVLHSNTFTANTWSSTMNFHAFQDTTNAVGTTSSTLSCRVGSICRLGPLLTQPVGKYGTATGTYSCKSSAGNLHSLAVGSVAANGGVVTLYDSASGTSTSVIGAFTFNQGGNSFTPVSIPFNGLPFFNGLVVVVSSQNVTFTVIYE